MMRDMMKWCCGPDGRPDVGKMTEYMERHDRTSKFDAAGWAMLFIWVGIAWLADVGLGVGLLGAAAITLGMQAIRKAFGILVEGFWVFIGICFAVAGLWQWLDVQLPLTPIILIGIGVALLFSRVLPENSRTEE
jgi:hypothetical protein